ncbi:deoxyribonuclease IV ['Elaeagnus angustifolia' witches'-broom phytoplasma]|uniref:Probable endonuclease 4 n=1 Tax='Elaeagnus angustifolia' witches'-broom phytoplasma TaxID=1538355 RepID=A0ABS5V965_9MOLU|nr:deoxyribonuclease IV ['Elaeagnus angustifolia' witches'-broom phytoplasma]MCX2955754.1 deoxyribonuclease IV [Candidatus Phytoplasma australiense]
MLFLGSHVAMKKPHNFQGAIQTAISYGANALMVYSGAPQNTIRTKTEELKIKEALEIVQNNNLSLNNLVGHAPYIINLANPDETKRAFAIDFLSQELERFAAMKINKMVLHPGNYLKTNPQEGISLIAQSLDLIFEKTKHLKTQVALETMAGKGTEIGKNLEELQQIRTQVKNNTRVSFCLDTCHLFDAGYDLKENLEEIIQNIDSILGFQNISVIHINDSKNECNSHKDRHENIGFGKIGFETLLKIIYHRSFACIPKILETPYINDKAPYKREIEMIKAKAFNPELKKLF